MSENLQSTFTIGDIVEFEFGNYSLSESSHRSPSSYYYDDPKFAPEEGVKYRILSVTFDKNRKVHFYKLEREDKSHEDFLYVLYETLDKKIFYCVDQTHFKPAQLDMIKI